MDNEKYYKRTFAKPAEYNGTTFRSTLEKDFAMFLDGQLIRYKGANYYHKPIKWEYESKEFELLPQVEWIDRTEKDKTVKTISRNKKHILQRVIFTPDFYLLEHNLIVETKGFQFDDGLFRLRLRMFKHYYPQQAIWIVTSHNQFMDIDKVLDNIYIKKEEWNGIIKGDETSKL